MKHIYGTGERVFINNSLGCDAVCKYCYLPSLKNDKCIHFLSGEEIISQIENNNICKYGRNSTIISIGCYSECLSIKNYDETMKIVDYFIEKENYIQLATKQRIPEEFCIKYAHQMKFAHQLIVYISIPIYSQLEKFEFGTVSITERINNIHLCKKYGLDVVLYIKPFLSGITDKDLDYYIEIVKAYKIPVVVGAYLSDCGSSNMADVGEQRLYEISETKQMQEVMKELSKYTNVYSHSTDIIKILRDTKEANENV